MTKIWIYCSLLRCHDKSANFFHLQSLLYCTTGQHADDMPLVWPLADDVPGRAIVACNENGAAVASDASAAHHQGITPDYLCVVPTYFPRCARITAIIVVNFLGDPQLDGLKSCPSFSTPPEEVLTIWSAGMHKPTVADPLVGVVLCVGGKGITPHQWTDSNWSAGSVVRIEICLGRVLRLDEPPSSPGARQKCMLPWEGGMLPFPP